MTYESTYARKGYPNITVIYMGCKEPVIPQSCYMGEPQDFIRMCRYVNRASESAFDAYTYSGLDMEPAATSATKLVETMIYEMGYVRVSTNGA